MTKHRAIKRSLSANALVEVSGCGDRIVFKLTASRTTKGGTYEHYSLEIESCRHTVTQLLSAIRKMHQRDRDRLAREQARIDREIRELTQE